VPSLAHHQSNDYTKLLLEGDSGSGKTGSLASLVGAGYKLRILDMDNGLDALKAFVTRTCPERIDNVEYRTLRDKRKASAEGPIIDGAPKAFVAALRMLDRWRYTLDDGTELDLGVPATWGPDCILCVDSLTFLSNAAFDWAEPLAPRSRGGEYDKRAVYKAAQDAIEGVLALLTSESFKTNVIVISHIRYVENPDGTKKGYPTSVGSALSPEIPAYFNTVAQCRSTAGVRKLRTAATALLDLKNPKPFEAAPEYDIGDGLGKFFATLRAGHVPAAPTKPTLVTRRT
jgi:hypothetical protein